MADAVLEHRGVRVTWSEEERTARFAVDSDRAFTGEAADVIIPVVSGWAAGRHYGILVDASNVDSTGSEWRMRWASHHQREGDRARIAIVSANLFVRTLLNSYARVTGRPLRMFQREDDARAWLRAVVPR